MIASSRSIRPQILAALVALLAYLGKSKRQLAIVGTGFHYCRVSDYFLLGPGPARGGEELLREQRAVVRLGLPKSVKQWIHEVIWTHLTMRGLIVDSITVGFLASLLKSLCTG